MQKIYTLVSFILICYGLTAQTTATFENFGLSAGNFLDGSDGSGGFSDGNVFLPNDYNAEFLSWSGWAISTITDALTPGFGNQYSAITGGGYDGSATYAVSYVFGGTLLELEGAAAGGVVEGLFVTNSTYAYRSMLDGDSFSKKFGGETGDDPDFFLLTIKKYLNGSLGADSVNFYLADYRFDDNKEDYIVNDWTYVDLTSLGNADSLLFTLSSSDVGQFGMNTPAYFCVDHITTRDMTTSTLNAPQLLDFEIYPNPVADVLIVDWTELKEADLVIFDISGRPVQSWKIRQGQNRLDLSKLIKGTYLLHRTDQHGWKPQLIVKR